MHTQNNQLILIKKNSLYLLFFSIFFFILLSLFVFFNINTQEFDIEMVTVSIFFFFFLTFILINEENKFTLIIFFSLLFYGYVFSGLYFSYYQNIHTAKFFNFHGNFTTEDIKESLYKVVCGYIFFVLGYKLSNRIKIKKVNLEIKNINYKSKKIEYILIILFLISFSYWIFVSYRITNGPISLLSNMGIYELLLHKSYISTAPYILAYVSTSFLFIIYLKNKRKISLFIIFMIISSFIMYVSTARLSGAVFYLISFPLMYAIYFQFKVNLKILLWLSLFAIFLGFLYFFRFYSNLSYLGLEIDSNIFKLMGEHFFGMTNFGDLQSITFANQYTKDYGYLYGLSFFDFSYFWISKIFWIDLESTSIGTRLTNYYFYHVDSGSPAPGIISEVIMNFGYVGLTVIMFLIGVILNLISKSINLEYNIFNLYVYTNFLLFALLLTKVDSSHISSLIWSIMPLYLLGIVLRKKVKLNEK